MGFLERAIRNGIRKGIGDAVGNAVQRAVEPKATELANQAAERIDQANRQNMQRTNTSSDLESALGNLERSMQGYATEAAKNTKICPKCSRPSTADVKFCPGCGTKLPEETLAAGAVCSSCGKQNSIGTKFCSECGSKLPAALAEEEAEAERSAEIMSRWESELGAYPKWDCGGKLVDIEMIEAGSYYFTVDFNGNTYAAKNAVEQYRQLAIRFGFRSAGEYPSNDHLYKKLGDICYHIDFEHCFDGDSDCPVVAFDTREPCGGFDYVKPEPKKGGLFKLFK